MTLQATAALVGGWCWSERRLFEIVGRWAATMPEPEAKVLAATQAGHHAFHAELLERCVPTAYVPPWEELLVPPAGAPALEALDALEDTLSRLTGLFDVIVPAAVGSYRAWRQRANPTSDGPLLRALRMIEADEMDDWADGQALLRRLVYSPAEVERAAEVRALIGKGLVKCQISGNLNAESGR